MFGNLLRKSTTYSFRAALRGVPREWRIMKAHKTRSAQSRVDTPSVQTTYWMWTKQKSGMGEHRILSPGCRHSLGSEGTAAIPQ